MALVLNDRQWGAICRSLWSTIEYDALSYRYWAYPAVSGGLMVEYLNGDREVTYTPIGGIEQLDGTFPH